MWQRIQTVYLAVSTILCVVCMLFPFAKFIEADGSICTLWNYCIEQADGSRSYNVWAMVALLAIAAFLQVMAISFYKNRMMQIRVVLLSALLLVGYYVVAMVFAFVLKADAELVLWWPVVLPPISIILDWLAVRAIGRDEMLVHAYERLR